eukprot:m.509842 g.509842  ORF g.509842 m.509842 type:complete len:3508 (+) comp57411_c0_seq1:30-10553(+)
MSWFKRKSVPAVPPRPAAAPQQQTLPQSIHELRLAFDKFERIEQDQEQAHQLEGILRSFCHEMTAVNPFDIDQLFRLASLKNLATIATRFFVKEVRQRAASHSTEDASVALERFFISEPLGNLLLMTEDLLLANRLAADQLSQAAFPSTLVKTFYLFLDLPPPASEQSIAQRDELCARLLTLLAKMCQMPSGCDELVRTGDLARLFDVVGTACSPSNAIWRQAAANVLSSMSRSSLSESVIQFISDENSLGRLLVALQMPDADSSADYIDICSTLLLLVLGSVRSSERLLNEFRNAEGYQIVKNFILAYEHKHPKSARALQSCVSILRDLVFCGVVDLGPQTVAPAHVHSGSSSAITSLALETQLVSSGTIRNLFAFRDLQQLFLEASTDELCSGVMAHVYEIVVKEPGNYEVIEAQNTIALFIEKATTLSAKLQEQVFRLVEHVVCALGRMPLAELTLVVRVIKKSNTQAFCTAMRTIINFINFDSSFANTARQIGLLDVLIAKLANYSTSVKGQFDFGIQQPSSVSASSQSADGEPAVPPPTSVLSPGPQDPLSDDATFLLMECLSLLIANSPENAAAFRQAGGDGLLFDMIPFDAARMSVLRVIQQLILSNLPSANDDFRVLLGQLHSAPPTDFSIRMDLLRCCMKLFSLEAQLKHAFRETQGFVYVISIFTVLSVSPLEAVSESSTEPSAEPCTSAEKDPKHELIKVIFQTLTMALEKNSANKQYFLEEVGYTILSDSLKLSSLMQTRYAKEIIQYLFAMATETFGREHDYESLSQQHIYNAHVVNVVASLLTQADATLQQDIFKQMSLLVQRESNAQSLSNVSILVKLTSYFREQLGKPDDPLYDILWMLVKTIGSYRISPAELRALFRLRLPGADSHSISFSLPFTTVSALVEMLTKTTRARHSPVIELDSSKTATGLFLPALTHVPGLRALPSDRAWPPANGITLATWVRIDAISEQAINILTLFCPTEPESVLFQLLIEPQTRHLTVRTTEVLVIPQPTLDLNRWYHVAITCSRNKLRHCQLTLYIDGQSAHSARHPFVVAAPAQTPQSEQQSFICARIGQAAHSPTHGAMVFSLACFYFLDDCLPQHFIQLLCELGPAYDGNLQASLRYMLPWNATLAQRPRAHSISRLRAASINQSGFILTPQGLVDLTALVFPLIPEDRIWISLHAHAVPPIHAQDALAWLGGMKAFRMFSREIGERDTRARLTAIRNDSPVASAPAIVIGRARAFRPAPACAVVDQVGGMSVILKIIADATSVEYLNEGMKLLELCIKLSPRNAAEMKRRHLYTTLSGILSGKQAHFSSELITRVLGLCEHSASNSLDSTILTNHSALQHLILDFQMWRKTDVDLVCCLFFSLQQLVSVSRMKSENIDALRQLEAIEKLIGIVQDTDVSPRVNDAALALLVEIVTRDPRPGDFDLLRRALLVTFDRQFLVESEKGIDVANPLTEHILRARQIRIRNAFLKTLLDFSLGKLPLKTVEEFILRSFGCEGLFVLLQHTVHDSSVLLALRLFSILLRDPSTAFATKFRSHHHGFHYLAELLKAHIHLGDMYFYLIAILYGRNYDKENGKFCLSSLHEVFPFKEGEPVTLANPDCVRVLLELLHELHIYHSKHNVPDDTGVPEPGDDESSVASGDQLQVNPPDAAFGDVFSQQQDVSVPSTPGLDGVQHVMCNKQFELRVRTEPDMKGVVVGQVAVGELVTVISERGNWCQLLAKPHWVFPPTSSSRAHAWAIKTVSVGGITHQMLQEAPVTVASGLPNNPFGASSSIELSSASNPFGAAPASAPNPFAPSAANPFDAKPASATFLPARPAPQVPAATQAAAPMQTSPPKKPSLFSSPPPTPPHAQPQPSKAKNIFGFGSQKSTETPTPFASNPRAIGSTISSPSLFGPKEDTSSLSSSVTSSLSTTSATPSISSTTTTGSHRPNLFSSAKARKGFTNPFFQGSRSASSSQLGTSVGALDPFASVEQPWPLMFPETITKYMNFLMRRSMDFVSLLLSPEKLEGLVFVLFVPAQGSDTEPGDDQDKLTDASALRWTPGDSQVRIATMAKFALYLDHPNADTILSLLRGIIIEQMSASRDKGLAGLETILDSPPHTRKADLHLFQLELFKAILAHLTASKVLVEVRTSPKLIVNMGKFAQLISERVTQNEWVKEEQTLVHFFAKLLRQVLDENGNVTTFQENSFGAGVLKSTAESICKAMSRLVLLQFARVDDGTATLEQVIAGVVDDQVALLAECNRDSELIGCLLFKALALIDSSEAFSRDVAFNFIRTLFQRRMKDLLSLCPAPLAIPANTGSLAAPVFTAKVREYRAVAEDSLVKSWQGFQQSKQRVVTSGQARMSRRLAYVAKRDKKLAHNAAVVSDFKSQQAKAVVQEHSWARTQTIRRQHKLLDARRGIKSDWLAIADSLHRERGLWGPSMHNSLNKWMLDAIEGPSRMRKRLTLNRAFYDHYPYLPDVDTGVTEESNVRARKKPPTSLDCKLFFESTTKASDQAAMQASPDALLNEDEQVERELEEQEKLLEETGEAALAEQPPVNKPISKLGTIDYGSDDESGTEDQGEAGAEEDSQSFPSNPTATFSRSEAPGDTSSSDASKPPLAKTGSQLSVGLHDVGPGDGSSPAPRRHVRNMSLVEDLSTSFAAVQHSVTKDNPIPDVDEEFAAEQGDDENEDPVLLRVLEVGDVPLRKEAASRVSGLDPLEGVFLICELCAYFLEGYAIGMQGLKQLASSTAQVFKWRYEDIKDIRRRRYRLQERALEIFAIDGNNHLLTFGDFTARETFFALLSAKSPSLAESTAESLEEAKVEKEGLLSGLIRARTVTQRWEVGEISNFEYLMQLNTLAGRSYNDLNQYPVFPWIIADYESEELDLEDACTYRDLGKPMGGQTPTRAEGFKLRFESWVDEETPPFHYGTHYSSAAIVSSYLVRMEPFTQHFIKVQGGHFDHPDRMFHSIHDAWLSASERNNADVKELIPEFFYLPEFLTNSNRFLFGVRQNKEILDDVVLPAWAKGDPREFIRVNRQALESDYVSSRLHEWIDLIFGFKQQGEEGIKSLNVFHHLTYEGAVDIDAISDPVQRAATISIIDNFGQTPKQLFKRPHPQKRVVSVAVQLQWISRLNNLTRLVTAVHPIRDISQPVGQIVGLEKPLVTRTGTLFIPPQYTKLVKWGIGDGLTVCSADNEREYIQFEGLHASAITAVNMVDSRTLVTGGEDTTVRAWTYEIDRGRGGFGRLKYLKTLCGHVGAITCLSSASSYNVLVSGSDDQTCIVWDLVNLEFIRQLRGHAASITAVAINSRTGDIVTCDASTIFLWSINGQQLASASTRVDGSISCCTFSETPEWHPDQLILVGSQDGKVRAWSRSFVKTGKGSWRLEQCADVNIASTISNPAPLTCLRVSQDLCKVLIGDSRGRVFSSSLPDSDGKMSDHWIRDSMANVCMSCNVRFSFSERKHHCRNCGKVFCGKCSARESAIPSMNIYKPVRVCLSCFQMLAESNAGLPAASESARTSFIDPDS